jgi:RHS repeat-associated protein
MQSALVLLVWTASIHSAQVGLADQAVSRGLPDRTVPREMAAQTALEFSANPTTQEIFRARVFEEPLVPVGSEPTAEENAALADALLGYARRGGPDDFSSLTTFLERHPLSPWRAAMLNGLGLEYYNTAHYSKALDAWRQAWELTRGATDANGKAIADRAVGELAYMYARLGRMQELEALLQSLAGRELLGSATERIAGAREGLWNMQNRPEIAFRCGPLALLQIQRATDPEKSADMVVYESASTQQGMSLPQVAAMSARIGLNYQMAFREADGDFAVPSVIHWKLGHYAAIIRREGDEYLLQDPTFLNDVWATRAALEAESSGYFLIPPGDLPRGWRAVEAKEGQNVWGKGNTQNLDPKPHGPPDPRTGDCGAGGGGAGLPFPSGGMASSSVHLMLVNLNLTDTPVGYAPSVGPAVGFTVRYNHRDAFQPATFSYSNFGPKWTCDWISYITDNPQIPQADVNYYIRGGGTRTFKGFNANSQTYDFQQYDQTQLRRTGPASYEMLARNGSKMVFSRSDGSVGTSRKIFLTQVSDPFGNTVTLNYDGNLRLTSITDAIGQVTTLTYGIADDLYKITQVTDPFGRLATFDYDISGRLTNITDVIGLQSQFVYEGSGDFINALITPYGTNSFLRGQSGTTRWLETVFADGSRDRVEFNQSTNLAIGFSDPPASVPQGMSTDNRFLWFRNTYYWSRTACASSYGDYSKAKVYHWLHTEDVTTASGILESIKEPLEGRVWYAYAGQGSPIFVGSNNRPTYVGRVLDDGATQLYQYGYNGFGNVTNRVDPVGRTYSYLYDTNGIDLLEVRMTRAGKNELLFKATYNAQHLPLTTTDAAGQTTTNTYNAQGQLLTTTNPKGETTSYTYSSDGYLIAVDGPLSGTQDRVTATYDALGRTLTKTDDSGYTLTFGYDALDRITSITYPDLTFDQITYDRLDPAVIEDRAGRQTFLQHDALRNLVQRTDPLGRVTRFQWCDCGDIKSLIDPMGRRTEWQTDVQGRLVAKVYGDGSRVSYFYESASGRLRQMVDEKAQFKQFTYNRDNTLRSVSYLNATVPTPSVTYTYDTDYLRRASMTDGIGTTLYSYVPITGTPTFGAGQPASVDGPYANDTMTYTYDELGRIVGTAIHGFGEAVTHDAAGRVVSETNALGSFTYVHDGGSGRVLAQLFPNGLSLSNTYGGVLQDHRIQQLAYEQGGTPVSTFAYAHDIPLGRIAAWSQQAGTAPADLYTFAYDDADRLLSAAVTNSGILVDAYAYSYDAADNRLLEVAGGITNTASYNALNQISASTATSGSRTNEWDAQDRLVAVTTGTQRTEFFYDGESRLAAIRQLSDGVQISFRRFLWSGDKIRQEREETGSTVIKRFFPQGFRMEAGPDAGSYYYTRDHLGSVRELTDAAGSLRSRYAYDPYGRQVKRAGDLEADFGFAGMFWTREAQLNLTWYRAYDPELGRWLSRDPLSNAEESEGPNLYAYVGNNPINYRDPLGLCCEKELADLASFEMLLRQFAGPRSDNLCDYWRFMAQMECTYYPGTPGCMVASEHARVFCRLQLEDRLKDCLQKPCKPCAGNNQVGAAPAGGGGFGKGLPDAGADIGKINLDYREIDTFSAGKPAERNAANTSVSVPQGD